MREAKAGKSGKMHVGPCSALDAVFDLLGYQRGLNLEGLPASRPWPPRMAQSAVLN